MKTLNWAALALACCIVPAHGQQVYPGCAIPPASPNNVWYIDAVNGSATGNGSQAQPWNSLQAVVTSVNGASPLLSTIPYRHRNTSGAWVVTANPSAPIQPGDEILLMSGNYGDISIGSNLTTIANPQFVTIAAAPGQTPVLSTLLLMSTSNWLFSGLTIQSLKTSSNTHSLIFVYDQGAAYPASNIVFEDMTVSSQSDMTGWTQAQWQASARQGMLLSGSAGGQNTTCISVTGSHFTNINNGPALFANNTLFNDNEIDHFGSDGLDYAASNLTITQNYLHDHLGLSASAHDDMMQGQPGNLASGTTVNYFSNILIDSNTIIRQVDPSLAYPAYIDGIDAFDEDWTNVTVTNNIIVTSACWGIAYASVHSSVIANNTVIEDGLVSMPGNCSPVVSVADKTSESPNSSSNTTVSNNLATAINVDNLDSGVEADHNVIVSINGKGFFAEYVNGVDVFASKPGTYGTNNIIDSGGAASEFVNFSPSTLTYNMMLIAGAPASGAGSVMEAPADDILGLARTAPSTAGAYGYPN